MQFLAMTLYIILAVPYHTFQQTDLPILRNFAPHPNKVGRFYWRRGDIVINNF